MFLNGYWLRVSLFWGVAAFAAATFVVAVQRTQLKEDLGDMREKIDMFEALNAARLEEPTLGARHRRDLDEEAVTYRLPSAMEPTNYDLYLHPDLEAGTFTGQVKITIKVLKATRQIVLHSYKLDISDVYVLNREVISHQLNEEFQLLYVHLAEELAVDATITLGIVFGGQSVNKLVGLYSSSYVTPAGQQRNIATTKFEPTYARQAFPCFDEPAMKATFTISVVHPTEGSYDALSNMDKTESMLLGENTMATFSTSVPMSTYLACIIVSDFDYETGTVKANGIGEDFTMRAYATPHQLNKVKYALEFGTAVTEYYIQYFKVAYPLPKLDMAAIPDFASGAMEHWGLVTYRETALLYDEAYSSTLNKQSIAGVLAHEITHQWFGNLVTMKWWNDLWLNEGFARFMQYKGVNAVHPDWGMLEQFQIMALHSVLVFDSKLSSHPIVQEVETPDEITAIFDTISYEKAGSVLRMLESLVGEDKFAQAVTNYLTNNQYGNTVTDDFLTEVAAQVTGYDVKLLMRTWTEQMGYPVLYVERTNDAAFTITQKRFLSNKGSYDEPWEGIEFSYKWSVPITYFLDTTESTADASSFIYAYDQDAVGVAVDANVKWIKLNVHQVGYYRVNYETSIWEQLIAQLVEKPSRFDIADRAHLLNDAFALADASQLSYNVPLEMTSYLAQERDFVPWYVAASKLESLARTLMYTESYVSYLAYARSLLDSVYKEVGWTVDTDNHLRNRLRVSVLTAACALGMPDCLEQAAERFNTWLQDPTTANQPAPDLRLLVYKYGMQQTRSEADWETLLNLFQAETDASEKLKLMYGLAAVQDTQLLYRFLELANDESIVRSQDYFTCVQYIAANPVGEPIVWDYYREQWPQLTARFGLNDRNLGKLIASITSNFASQVKLEEVQLFYTKYPESGAGASPRQQAIETIKYNINWLQENSGAIGDWLAGTAAPLKAKNPQ